MLSSGEMLHSKDFVGGERAQDMRQSEGFRITLLKNIVSDEFFDGFNLALKWHFAVDIQSERKISFA
jgi:hypothetical protein